MKTETKNVIDLYYKKSITSQKLIAFLNSNETLTNEEIYKQYHKISNRCLYCSSEMKYSGFKNGYRCSKECGNKRRRKQLKKLEINKVTILSKVTKLNYISHKFLNEYNLTEQYCYDLVFGTKTCKFCDNKAIFINWANGYQDKCNNEVCSKKLRAERTQQTNLERYGFKNVSSVKEVQIKKQNTFKTNYGVDNVSQLQSTIFKMRKTNELSGRWIPYNKKEDKKHYEQKVRNLTEKQNIKSLCNFEKRGPVEKGGYHLDHKVSISDGFKNNIPIHIIANIKNLCFIPARENQSKNFRSSISINNLIKSVLSTDNKLLVLSGEL